MTIDEFRANKDLVSELRKALELPIVQQAMAVLRENGPEYEPLKDTSPHGAHILLGVSRGFAAYDTRLKLLATYPATRTTIPNDYSGES